MTLVHSDRALPTSGAALSQLKSPFSTWCASNSFPMCKCFFFFCFSAGLLSWLWFFQPWHSFIQYFVWQQVQSLLQIVRSTASPFKWEYPLLSLRSSSSSLRLLPRLHVTSISPFIFPLITCFRKQFLCKMWPIQLAIHFLISCRIFLCSLTLSNTSSFLTWSVQLIFSILLQHHIEYSTNDKKKPIVSITDDINVMTETNVHWKISVTLEKKYVYTQKKLMPKDND